MTYINCVHAGDLTLKHLQQQDVGREALLSPKVCTGIDGCQINIFLMVL
jgi:hypothetical protein